MLKNISLKLCFFGSIRNNFNHFNKIKSINLPFFALLLFLCDLKSIANISLFFTDILEIKHLHLCMYIYVNLWF